MTKRYFAINIHDDNAIEFFDNLDDAKESCLNSATEQYEYACYIDDLDNEICDQIHNAVFGVVMGGCKLPKRPADKNDEYEGGYDYIVEPPVLELHNGWISVKDRLPEINDDTLKSDMLLLYGHEEEFEPKSIFIGYMYYGNRFYSNAYGEGCKVTHWQPLPPRPQD